MEKLKMTSMEQDGKTHSNYVGKLLIIRVESDRVYIMYIVQSFNI